MPPRGPVETFEALERHVDQISGNPALPANEEEIVSPDVARVLIRGQAQDKLTRLANRIQIPIDRMAASTGAARDRLVLLRDAILEESRKVPGRPTDRVGYLVGEGFRGFEGLTTQGIRDVSNPALSTGQRWLSGGLLGGAVIGTAGLWYAIMRMGKAEAGKPKRWGDTWWGKLFKMTLGLTVTVGTGWAAAAYVKSRQQTELDAQGPERQPDIAALNATTGRDNVEFGETLRNINLGLLRNRRLNISPRVALQFQDSGGVIQVTRFARTPGSGGAGETVTRNLRVSLSEIRVDANGEVFLRPAGGEGIYLSRTEFIAMMTGASAGQRTVQGFIQPAPSSGTRTDRRTVTLEFAAAT